MKQLFEYPLSAMRLSLSSPMELSINLKNQLSSTRLKVKQNLLNKYLTMLHLLLMGWHGVRFIKAGKKTYKEYADSLLKFILGSAHTSRPVDIVFDKYIDNSIKEIERNHPNSRNSPMELAAIF